MNTRDPQYKLAKETSGDSILAFRNDERYEFFGDDAIKVSALCGLAKSIKDGDVFASCPAHHIDAYLTKLVKNGFRVAVCEQVGS